MPELESSQSISSDEKLDLLSLFDDVGGAGDAGRRVGDGDFPASLEGNSEADPSEDALAEGDEGVGVLFSPDPPISSVDVDPKEIVRLCAVDDLLYCRVFFEKTFRQKSPAIHSDIFAALEDQSNRFVSLSVFRGGAKTTLLRAFVSKRIAYGTSRTILFVSASQPASRNSLTWLRKQVMFNKRWATTYGLEPGAKWNEDHLEIIHRTLGITINVIALGITGQVRGINIDDYRPDLIVCDDPCDEENTATDLQRKKISDLFFGALQNSLAPASECPDAKMALLQTPLNAADLVSQCSLDPAWTSRIYSCLDENGESVWEDRFPTHELLRTKQQFIDRGQASIWLREMECTVVGEADAKFRSDWLQYYHEFPPRMACFMAVDPVPPPSEKQLKAGLKNKDYEVFAVVGIYGDSFYLLEVASNRGHDPDWSIATFFRLLDKWRPLKVRVEVVAYQRVLKWLFEKAMKERRRYVQIDESNVSSSKVVRITQSLTGVCSNKRFFVRPTEVDFISQFTTYPNVAHDDVIEAVAVALAAAQELDVLEGEFEVVGAEVEKLDQSDFRKAP